MNNVRHALGNRKWIGWFLVFSSFGLGLVTLYKGEFGDEADNLVVGTLIWRGYALYRDVFSHHFPFPYYWMALVVGLFGKSIYIARLSLLVFQTVAFALGMRLSEDYLTVGVAAIMWSIMRSFYRGNMVLYNAFAGTSLLVVAVIVLAVLQQRVLLDWNHCVALGIFSLIAVLSDPLSVYAISIALFLLFTKKPLWGVNAGLVFVGGLALYAVYLFATGNAQVFWDSAILFNSQIYTKYNDTKPLRIGELVSMMLRGLELTDAAWFNFNPFKPITGIYTDLDQWFFTGFLYRFAIIANTVLFIHKKQYRAAVFMYLFAASNLITNKWGFRAQPFIIIALLAISTLITNAWWHETGHRFLRTTQIIVSAMVLVVTGWLCLRLTVDIYTQSNTYGAAQFASVEQESAYIQKLACNQPDVLLAHYPFGSYYYWFTDMRPVSKYVFMWPWVAEVGLNDVIHELSQKQLLAIVVRKEGSIWGLYDTNVYLRPLDVFLKETYRQVANGIYLSPALDARCSQ